MESIDYLPKRFWCCWTMSDIKGFKCDFCKDQLNNLYEFKHKIYKCKPNSNKGLNQTVVDYNVLL